MAALACVPTRCAFRVAPRFRERVCSRWRVPGRASADRVCATASAEASVRWISGSDPPCPHETRVKVYIEHTDAYQVVYHANYFKFLGAGREACLFGGAEGEEKETEEEEEEAQGTDDSASRFGRPRVMKNISAAPVVRIDDVKFVSPATLGDELVVCTSVESVNETRNTIMFRQQVNDVVTGKTRLSATVTVKPAMRDDDMDGTDVMGTEDVPKGDVPEKDDAGVSTTVERDADDSWFEISKRHRTDDAFNVSAVRETRSPFVTRVTLHRHELSLGEFGFCETDVLRFFERNRTEALGGAGALNSLKQNGTIVVVAGAQNLRFAPGGMAALTARRGANRRMRQVLSVSQTELKRRGLQITFHHELIDGKRVVASGEVTCVCVSTETRRPVRCPEDLAGKFA
jgi:acyl-CoA thioesterase FadM